MKTATTYLSGLCMVLFQGAVLAQEYKIQANAQTRLELDEVNEIIIEGYNGSEIVFTVSGENYERPDRAKGLRAISGLGLEDNTGIGLSVEKDGNTLIVQEISRKSDAAYTIRVPNQVNVVYHHSTTYGEDILVSDFSGELEISTLHNDIDLKRITGPMTVKTVHGDVEAIFSDPIKNPVSIVSTHGDLDISLPSATKARLELMSEWGEMFTDLDIDFEKSAEDLRKVSSSVVKGTINGGGDLMVELSSVHGDIFLRKQ